MGQDKINLIVWAVVFLFLNWGICFLLFVYSRKIASWAASQTRLIPDSLKPFLPNFYFLAYRLLAVFWAGVTGFLSLKFIYLTIRNTI